MAPARRDYDEDDYGGPSRRRDSSDNDRYDDEREDNRRNAFDFANRSFRKDDYDDREDYDDRYSGRRGGGFRCPYCRTSERPYVSTQISPAGWVIFVVMLLTCLPLFFIGLLMTEEVRTCSDCGVRIG